MYNAGLLCCASSRDWRHEMSAGRASWQADNMLSSPEALSLDTPVGNLTDVLGFKRCAGHPHVGA